MKPEYIMEGLLVLLTIVVPGAYMFFIFKRVSKLRDYIIQSIRESGVSYGKVTRDNVQLTSRDINKFAQDNIRIPAKYRAYIESQMIGFNDISSQVIYLNNAIDKARIH